MLCSVHELYNPLKKILRLVCFSELVSSELDAAKFYGTHIGNRYKHHI